MDVNATNVGNVNGAIDIRGMDLETAMMAVQSNRANLLEAQLKDQINAVQEKNNQIAKLNTLLGALNAAAAKVPSETKTGDSAKLSAEDAAAIQAAAKDAGVTLPGELKQSWDVKLADGSVTNVDAAGKKEADDCKKQNWAFRSSDYSGNKGITSITEVPANPNKGQLESLIQTMKPQIDGLSNTQQMDMVRLQSLSNKRNEAFDLMSNFTKKMSDGRASIIGNMR